MHWSRLFEANLLSAVGATSAVLPHVREGATIVNVAAAAAGRGALGIGPYRASKAAVLRLTESLAEELAPRRIHVYSVSPTILDTPRNRADMPDADVSRWIAPGRLAARMLALLDRDAPSGSDFHMSSATIA